MNTSETPADISPRAAKCPEMALAVKMLILQSVLVLGISITLFKHTGGVTVAFRRCVKASTFFANFPGPLVLWTDQSEPPGDRAIFARL